MDEYESVEDTAWYENAQAQEALADRGAYDRD